MKTRQGFVSNSSTTSFCIYGICISSGSVQEILKMPEDGSVWEAMEEEMKKNEVSLFINEYDGNYYIGRSFSDIADDETGKQFKTNIQEDINKVFFNKIPETDFRCYEEAWRDG